MDDCDIISTDLNSDINCNIRSDSNGYSTTTRGKKNRNGRDGRDGRDGNDGKDAERGFRGEKGENGLNGRNGKDGKDGVKGHDSVDGKNGESIKGDKGENGCNGRAGVDGRDGKPSRDGSDGIDGEKGECGRSGKDGMGGRDGKDGIDGTNGRKGDIGENGSDGSNGRDGMDGTNGRDGLVGKDGSDGIDGRTGDEGKSGRDGYDGSDGDGRDGEKGWKGDVGPAGKSGRDGRDGKLGVTGKCGEKGENGENGNKGERGYKGEIGSKIHIGTHNIIVPNMDSIDNPKKCDIWLNMTTGEHYVYDGVIWLPVPCCDQCGSYDPYDPCKQSCKSGFKSMIMFNGAGSTYANLVGVSYNSAEIPLIVPCNGELFSLSIARSSGADIGLLKAYIFKNLQISNNPINEYPDKIMATIDFSTVNSAPSTQLIFSDDASWDTNILEFFSGDNITLYVDGEGDHIVFTLTLALIN
jgi:hypothetical protein